MKKLFLCLAIFFGLAPKGFGEYIVIDDETEVFLTDIVKNLKGALGYGSDVKVYILSDRTINAAAIQSGDILVNAGALIQSGNYQEIIAILAHEVGHIEGKHIQQYVASARDFMQAGLVTTLIGAVASICSGNTAPLMAGIAGGQSIAQKMALGKLRQKENIADTKAATMIQKLQWPVFDGFVSVHKKLESKSFMYNKYLSTHPPSAERISKYENYAREAKSWKISEEVKSLMQRYKARFEIVKRKINALTSPVESLKGLYSNPKDVADRYARAVVLYRLGDYSGATKLIDSLPSGDAEQMAYYAEIKCMSLINMKRCKEAAEIAKKAIKSIKKIPNHRDLVVIFAEAVIAGNLKAEEGEAIKYLERLSLSRDGNISIWNELGKLYSKTGQEAKASLCAARYALETGDAKMARVHATRAKNNSDQATRIKASDVIDSANELEAEEKRSR